MNGRDEAIRGFLDRSIPLPSASGCDWGDVLARSRAAGKAVRTRRLVVAFAIVVVTAVVLAATPLGAMIANGFGSFSSWLSGSAGSPVTGRQKSDFAESTRKSWLRFPETASLRKLIDTTTDGVRYELFGFKVGDSLCLRLVTSQASKGTHTGCISFRELRVGRAPALPMFVDALVVGRVNHDRHAEFIQRAAVTFGIVSDGVTRISARTQSHRLEGIVAADAFLIVNRHYAKGARIRSVSVGDSRGDTSPVPLAHFAGPENAFREMNKPLPFGPPHLDRVVSHPTLRWVTRREPRGKPVPPGLLERALPARAFSSPSFARSIRPDPEGLIREIVSIQNVLHGQREKPSLCLTEVVDGRPTGGYCNFLDDPFPRMSGRPLPFWIGSSGGLNGEYGTISGMAADQVARMEVFLANGDRLPVLLRDDVYEAEVPFADYPALLAAYDRQGRLIGLQRLPSP